MLNRPIGGAEAGGVGMVRALRARDPQAAARSAALILVASGVVMALLPLLEVAQGHSGQWLLHGLTAGGLVVAAAACRRTPARLLDRYLVAALLSLGAVVLICALDLVTRDTSAGSQAFYALPVLWAASHLRAPAVVLVTTAALVGDCLTLFLLLPAGAAASDLVISGAVLVVIAAMLVRSIRVQEVLVAALQEQLTIDSLTGLATRRAFDRALAGATNRPVPGGTALVLIDVDSVEAINDSHGHPVGDDVLVHLAIVLRSRVRAEDAVLSRLGGDELAVLMPGCGRETAVQRAEELLAAVRSTPMTLLDGQLLALSISVGVAHLPQHSADRRRLYTAADAALYDAKRAGRGQVSVAAS
jgi:diguanylate cyclase (GGDEF)-like protein